MNGPKSYVEMMDDVVTKRAAGQKFGTPLRPSNAGTCARRIAHEYNAFCGNEEPIKETRQASVERLLALGHHVEEQIVDDFKLLEDFRIKYTQQEVDIFELPLGTKIVGSTDLCVFSEEHAGVLDVKTIGDRWEAAFASKWEKLLDTYRSITEEFAENSFWVEDLEAFLGDIGPDDSLYKNLIQLNLYAMSQFLQSRGVNHASILRYNKNNSKLMEIRFKPSVDVFNSTYNRFAAIEQSGVDRAPQSIPKERILGSMDCTYCPANKKCWPGATKSDHYQNSKKKDWATKIEDLHDGQWLHEVIQIWEANQTASRGVEKIERDIILALDKLGVYKIKSDGKVYEVKHLKSGSVFRRGKE